MKIFFNFWLTKFFHSIKHTKVSTVYRVFQLLKNAGFHSTRPAKASTRQHPQICQRYGISIHETHKDLDNTRESKPPSLTDFNPRDPQRPRPSIIMTAVTTVYFNPRDPQRPRRIFALYSNERWDFNPRDPQRPRRPDGHSHQVHHRDFNPRDPQRPRLLPLSLRDTG